MPAADRRRAAGSEGSPTPDPRLTVPPRDARIQVEVRPRARQNALDVLEDGVVRARVTASPADGAANEAVRRLLAGALHCARSAVEIVHGRAARTKVVRIHGLSAADVRARLGGRR